MDGYAARSFDFLSWIILVRHLVPSRITVREITKPDLLVKTTGCTDGNRDNSFERIIARNLSFARFCKGFATAYQSRGTDLREGFAKSPGFPQNSADFSECHSNTRKSKVHSSTITSRRNDHLDLALLAAAADFRFFDPEVTLISQRNTDRISASAIFHRPKPPTKCLKKTCPPITSSSSKCSPPWASSSSRSNSHRKYGKTTKTKTLKGYRRG